METQSSSVMTVTSEDCFIFDIVYRAQYRNLNRLRCLLEICIYQQILPWLLIPNLSFVVSFFLTFFSIAVAFVPIIWN